MGAGACRYNSVSGEARWGGDRKGAVSLGSESQCDWREK
jgi:hypothetical protein